MLFRLFLIISVQSASAFIGAPVAEMKFPRNSLKPKRMSEENAEDANNDADVPIIAQSTVRIDDGGSNLTDRFKYKVQALMGTYDPEVSDADNESADGNILGAMLNFPTSYVFNIVGKTNGDEKISDAYIEKAKDIVSSNTGDDLIDCIVKPRGTKFTKVMIEAMVASSSMITGIYDELAELDETIMRF